MTLPPSGQLPSWPGASWQLPMPEPSSAQLLSSSGQLLPGVTHNQLSKQLNHQIRIYAYRQAEKDENPWAILYEMMPKCHLYPPSLDGCEFLEDAAATLSHLFAITELAFFCLFAAGLMSSSSSESATSDPSSSLSNADSASENSEPLSDSDSTPASSLPLLLSSSLLSSSSLSKTTFEFLHPLEGSLHLQGKKAPCCALWVMHAVRILVIR